MASDISSLEEAIQQSAVTISNDEEHHYLYGEMDKIKFSFQGNEIAFSSFGPGDPSIDQDRYIDSNSGKYIDVGSILYHESDGGDKGLTYILGTNIQNLLELGDGQQAFDYFTSWVDRDTVSKVSVPEIVPYSPSNPNWLNSILDLGASQLVRTGVDLSGKITATADGGDKIGAFLVYLAKPPGETISYTVTATVESIL